MLEAAGDASVLSATMPKPTIKEIHEQMLAYGDCYNKKAALLLSLFRCTDLSLFYSQTAVWAIDRAVPRRLHGWSAWWTKTCLMARKPM